MLDEFHSSWDAHRSVTMAMDKSGRLHVVGAMHASPLAGDPSGPVPADGHTPGAYFRSDATGSVASLTRQTQIVSPEVDAELSYPVFHTLNDGRLVLETTNRYGAHMTRGFNVWNEASANWGRISNFSNGKSGDLFTMLYFGNSVRDSKGVYHFAWVWRTGPSFNEAKNGNRNGRVSYASTSDFSTWRNGAGQVVNLPVDWSDMSTVVDDVPPGTGLMPPAVSLDRDGSPLLTYMRNENRTARIYAAGLEGKKWSVHTLTDSGGIELDADQPGTFILNAQAGALKRHSDRRYTVDYVYNGYRGRLHVDTVTWKKVGDIPVDARSTTPSLRIPPSGMTTYLQRDLSGKPYSLIWNAYMSQGDIELGPVIPQPIHVYTTTN